LAKHFSLEILCFVYKERRTLLLGFLDAHFSSKKRSEALLMNVGHFCRYAKLQDSDMQSVGLANLRLVSDLLRFHVVRAKNIFALIG